MWSQRRVSQASWQGMPEVMLQACGGEGPASAQPNPAVGSLCNAGWGASGRSSLGSWLVALGGEVAGWWGHHLLPLFGFSNCVFVIFTKNKAMGCHFLSLKLTKINKSPRQGCVWCRAVWCGTREAGQSLGVGCGCGVRCAPAPGSGLHSQSLKDRIQTQRQSFLLGGVGAHSVGTRRWPLTLRQDHAGRDEVKTQLCNKL